MFILQTFSHHNDQQVSIKYFKFLDFWTDQSTFMKLVEQSWNTNVIDNPMWRPQSKAKMLRKNLYTWSRDVAGNVFDQVKIWEENLHYLEE